MAEKKKNPPFFLSFSPLFFRHPPWAPNFLQRSRAQLGATSKGFVPPLSLSLFERGGEGLCLPHQPIVLLSLSLSFGQ